MKAGFIFDLIILFKKQIYTTQFESAQMKPLIEFYSQIKNRSKYSDLTVLEIKQLYNIIKSRNNVILDIQNLSERGITIRKIYNSNDDVESQSGIADFVYNEISDYIFEQELHLLVHELSHDFIKKRGLNHELRYIEIFDICLLISLRQLTLEKEFDLLYFNLKDKSFPSVQEIFSTNLNINKKIKRFQFIAMTDAIGHWILMDIDLINKSILMVDSSQDHNLICELVSKIVKLKEAASFKFYMTDCDARKNENGLCQSMQKDRYSCHVYSFDLALKIRKFSHKDLIVSPREIIDGNFFDISWLKLPLTLRKNSQEILYNKDYLSEQRIKEKYLLSFSKKENGITTTSNRNVRIHHRGIKYLIQLDSFIKKYSINVTHLKSMEKFIIKSLLDISRTGKISEQQFCTLFGVKSIDIKQEVLK